MNKTNVFVIVLGTFLASANAVVGTVPSDKSKTFVTAADEVRKIWREIQPKTALVPTSYLIIQRVSLERIGQDLSLPGNIVVKYLATRLVILENLESAKPKQLIPIINQSIAPEYAKMLLEQDRQAQLHHGNVYNYCIAEMLPLYERREYNDEPPAVLSLVDPPRQVCQGVTRNYW